MDLLCHGAGGMNSKVIDCFVCLQGPMAWPTMAWLTTRRRNHPHQLAKSHRVVGKLTNISTRDGYDPETPRLEQLGMSRTR
jgi:hypothetical protein